MTSIIRIVSLLTLVFCACNCDQYDKQDSIIDITNTIWESVTVESSRTTTVDLIFYSTYSIITTEVAVDGGESTSSSVKAGYTFTPPSIKIQYDDVRLIGYITDEYMEMDNGLTFTLTSDPEKVDRYSTKIGTSLMNCEL